MNARASRVKEGRLGCKLLTKGSRMVTARQGENEAVAAWCGAGRPVVAVQLADGVGVDLQLGFLEPKLVIVDVLDAPGDGDGSGSVLSSISVLGSSKSNLLLARSFPSAATQSPGCRRQSAPPRRWRGAPGQRRCGVPERRLPRFFLLTNGSSKLRTATNPPGADPPPSSLLQHEQILLPLCFNTNNGAVGNWGLLGGVWWRRRWEMCGSQRGQERERRWLLGGPELSGRSSMRAT
jgi:hypothetical protein